MQPDAGRARLELRRRTAASQLSWLSGASPSRRFVRAQWPIQDEYVGGMDLGDAVRALPTLNESVAEPAHNVNQSASGEVPSSKLRQPISHDHGVPVRSVAITRGRIGRNAETGPYATRSFRREMNVGVTANSPDELHVRARAANPWTRSISARVPRLRRGRLLLFFFHGPASYSDWRFGGGESKHDRVASSASRPGMAAIALRMAAANCSLPS